MDWLKRMNSVLDYIEDNLDNDIDDNKIAVLSATPKGVFQRVFALITDMTLSDYMRKRRLTQAALLYTYAVRKRRKHNAISQNRKRRGIFATNG